LQFELPTDNKTSSTTWPSSAKLDAGAQRRRSGAKAEDEGPQAPKQSLRAHQFIKNLPSISAPTVAPT